MTIEPVDSIDASDFEALSADEYDSGRDTQVNGVSSLAIAAIHNDMDDGREHGSEKKRIEATKEPGRRVYSTRAIECFLRTICQKSTPAA